MTDKLPPELRALWAEMVEPRLQILDKIGAEDPYGLGEPPIADERVVYANGLLDLLLLREATSWYQVGSELGYFSRIARFEALEEAMPSQIGYEGARLQFPRRATFLGGDRESNLVLSRVAFANALDDALWDLTPERIQYLDRAIISLPGASWDYQLKNVTDRLSEASQRPPGWLTDEEVDDIEWAMTGSDSVLIRRTPMAWSIYEDRQAWEGPYTLPSDWRSATVLNLSTRVTALYASVSDALSALSERGLIRMPAAASRESGLLPPGALLASILMNTFGLNAIQLRQGYASESWSPSMLAEVVGVAALEQTSAATEDIESAIDGSTQGATENLDSTATKPPEELPPRYLSY